MCVHVGVSFLVGPHNCIELLGGLRLGFRDRVRFRLRLLVVMVTVGERG